MAKKKIVRKKYGTKPYEEFHFIADLKIGMKLIHINGGKPNKFETMITAEGEEIKVPDHIEAHKSNLDLTKQQKLKSFRKSPINFNEYLIKLEGSDDEFLLRHFKPVVK